MADNLTTTTTVSTVPSGSVIATDDVGGVHFQKVKIDVGGDGASAVLSNSNPLPVSDAGGTLTVDGTVAATQSGAWNVTNVSGTVSLPTGASTLAEQQTQTTALQLIDDTVYTDGTGTPSKAIGVAGTDGTNPQIIKTDSAGELQVDVLTMPTVAVTQSGTWDEVGIHDSGNSITVDATSLPLPTGASTLAEQQTQTTHLATIAGDTTDIETAVELLDDTVATLGTTTYSEATTKGLIVGAVRRDADTTLVDTTNEVAPLQVDANGRLKVEVFSGETLPVSGTVTANLAAGTNNIGDVDILSIAAGDNNIGNVDIASIAAGDNNIGNVDVVTLPALAAGTNAVGKLLPPDTDVTAHTNYAKKYYTSTGAATDGIIWSPAAGKRWHVVSMYLNVSAAATVTLEDDKAGGDEAIWKGEYAANSGVTIYFGEQYPLASGEDAADLLITTTAGNVYVTVVGYEV